MRDRRGFTLIETLVTVGLVSVMMIGLLTMLESSSRIAKQETAVADAQGGSRAALYEVSRILRQAGTGHLYWGNAVLPYANNAAASTTLTDTNGALHTLRPGTDAIEVRGVLRGKVDYFGPADVTCAGGDCVAGSGAITVTIRQTNAFGYQNYPAGKRPELAGRSGSFYYVITTMLKQKVTVGATSYLVPLVVAGRVNTSGSWFTETATSFSFTMDATDTDARRLNASNSPAPVVQSPYCGGAVDDILLYVDRGAAEASSATTFLRPYLAQGLRDPATGRWDVHPLVTEVEDMQIAYGLDGAGGSTPDGGVDPMKATSGSASDEWVLNASGETLTSAGDPPAVAAFLDGSVASVEPFLADAVPALKSITVSLLTISKTPDVRFRGAGALGIKLLDSTATSLSAATGLPYRRRVQSMAVNLRNFS